MKISRRNLLASGAAGAVVAATDGAAALAADALTMPLKQQELLLKHAIVVTMDPQVGVLTDCDIHVHNGAIVAIGPHLQAPAASVIDALAHDRDAGARRRPQPFVEHDGAQHHP